MPLPRDIFILSPEQFARIEELLLPGYECAKLMLADYQARAAQADEGVPNTESQGNMPSADDASKQGSG